MEQATPPAAAAGVDLSPAATDLGRVHLLPCGIKHNSAAAVSDYFKPRDTGVEVDGVKVEEAFFRGRNLQGATVALPDGYRGPSSFEQIMKNLGLENLRRKELDLTSKIFRGLCRILAEPKIATKLEFSHNLRTIVMVPYDVGRSLPFHAFSKICYVLEKKKNEEKDAQGMDEEASNFVSRAEFQNITYWNHDTMPSAEDPLPRCFHWLAVANAMHKPVTAEDMANMSARQNQNS